MSVIQTPDLLQSGILGVNHEFVLSAASPDLIFPIPGRLVALTLSVLMTSGSGQFEVLVTTNKGTTISAGTATWFSLGGARTASCQITIPARITAIRFVRTSGDFTGSFYAA